MSVGWGRGGAERGDTTRSLAVLFSENEAEKRRFYSRYQKYVWNRAALNGPIMATNMILEKNEVVLTLMKHASNQFA